MKKGQMLAGVSMVCLMLMGGGCAPLQPLSPEQQELNAAQNQCVEETNVMVGGWSSSIQWTSYFEWCMANMGVTPQQMRTLWY